MNKNSSCLHKKICFNYVMVHAYNAFSRKIVFDWKSLEDEAKQYLPYNFTYIYRYVNVDIRPCTYLPSLMQRKYTFREMHNNIEKFHVHSECFNMMIKFFLEDNYQSLSYLFAIQKSLSKNCFCKFLFTTSNVVAVV